MHPVDDSQLSVHDQEEKESERGCLLPDPLQLVTYRNHHGVSDMEPGLCH